MEGVEATAQSIALLRQTRPWVRLISVVILVAAGLMILAGAFVAIAAGTGTRMPNQAVIMIFYVAMALVYIAPAIYLGRYASRINDLLKMRRSLDLEAALQAQKSFWKFCGIFVTVVLCFYGLALVVGGIVLGIRFL